MKVMKIFLKPQLDQFYLQTNGLTPSNIFSNIQGHKGKKKKFKVRTLLLRWQSQSQPELSPGLKCILTEQQQPVTKVSGMATTDIAHVSVVACQDVRQRTSVWDAFLMGYLFYTHTEKSATKKISYASIFEHNC